MCGIELLQTLHSSGYGEELWSPPGDRGSDSSVFAANRRSILRVIIRTVGKFPLFAGRKSYVIDYSYQRHSVDLEAKMR